MEKLRIIQVKSGIDRSERQKRTLVALGIKRMHQAVDVDATPQILGMIRKVNHLLEVNEI